MLKKTQGYPREEAKTIRGNPYCAKNHEQLLLNKNCN